MDSEKTKQAAPPKNPGKSRSEASREKILNAARKVFAQKSYDAASIRMVAQEGGFPHGNIRNFFPSKAALFEDVVRGYCEEFLQGNQSWMAEAAALMGGEKPTPLSLEQGLSLYMDRLLCFCEKKPEVMQILNLNLYQAQQPEGMPGYRHILDLLRKSRSVFEGLLSAYAPPDRANRFSDAFNGLVIHFLGARSCQARVLGMDPLGPRYSSWVKETMIAVFRPMLRDMILPETRPGEE